MATPPQATPPDASKYYESRAKEFRERYESMRKLEWQTLLQTYAGYGAIAVAFQKVKDDMRLIGHKPWVSILAMAATLIFATVMHYLYYRIEERLIRFNVNADYYVKKISSQAKEQPLVIFYMNAYYYAYKMGAQVEHEVESLGTENLGHRFFWTYDMQMVVSTLTVMLLLLYEGYSSAPSAWIGITIVLFLGAILLWVAGRRKLDWLLKNLENSAKG